MRCDFTYLILNNTQYIYKLQEIVNNKTVDEN